MLSVSMKENLSFDICPKEADAVFSQWWKNEGWDTFFEGP